MAEQTFSFLEQHLSQFLGDRSGLAGEQQGRFKNLVLKLCASLKEGNSCLPVDTRDQEQLVASRLVSIGGDTPLVLVDGKVYLHRYYYYEKRFSTAILEFAAKSYELDEKLIKRFFPGEAVKNGSQAAAAYLALNKGLAIICGGPGTGKTTTVVKIIALLLESYGHELQVALAAPTGKAAVRLAESVAGSKGFIDAEPELKDAIPAGAQTLHRLLGYRAGSPQFKHNRENPMQWDVVVVDEASMIDLAMMSKLVDGLKPDARLILLGDKDQLASVESGSVLSDLLKSFPENSVELLKSYRFDENIKKLATSINKGQGPEVWEMLQGGSAENVFLLHKDELATYVGSRYEQYMQTALNWPEMSLEKIYLEFSRFQVLCAVHFGPMGVEGINRSVELYLNRKGYHCSPGNWYMGRPVLVTQNDYKLELFNGDIGICLPDPASGAPVAFFQNPGGPIKRHSLRRLPAFETVWAMTIHKSQGSEFEQVVVVLPEEENRVLSRELVYTGVTRAKTSIAIVAEQKILLTGLHRNIKRNSGLRYMLGAHSSR